jgi:uncharacterized membrane protein YkvA (DUF1232 family)
MNILTAQTLPLPACLGADCDPRHRRHRIGSFDISASALGRFNDLLGAVGSPQRVDCDRLVTAARSLCQLEMSSDMPVCIRQRLRRVRAAVSMAADSRWEAPTPVIGVVRLVAAYVASNDDLIPDRVPTVGRLDDAIAIDAAWPAVGDEVRGYVDFHRLRRLVARDRSQWAAFDRERWIVARGEEQSLLSHLQRVRSSSYVPTGVRMFRIA